MNVSEEDRDWDKLTGRTLTLDDWLAKILKPTVDEGEFLINYDFPTDEHADEYFATIDKRPEEDVVELLRRFLFPSCCFPQSDALQYSYLKHLAAKKGKPPPDLGPIRMMPFDDLLKREHTRRLLASVASNGKVPSWEGIRWVLDLLPHFPRSAIDALDAYILAHAQLLPDGRFSGLSRAVAIIRAKFIKSAPNDAGATLLSLDSREFEFLVERLFAAMGYDTEITKATRDGGKDVIAVRSSAAMRERVLVECKLYDRCEVGFPEVMRLLGVVTKEDATRGVVVTTGHVTDGAANADPRIEVIGRTTLIQLLNEHLGNRWPQDVDRIIRESMSDHGTK